MMFIINTLLTYSIKFMLILLYISFSFLFVSLIFLFLSIYNFREYFNNYVLDFSNNFPFFFFGRILMHIRVRLDNSWRINQVLLSSFSFKLRFVFSLLTIQPSFSCHFILIAARWKIQLIHPFKFVRQFPKMYGCQLIMHLGTFCDVLN